MDTKTSENSAIAKEGAAALVEAQKRARERDHELVLAFNRFEMRWIITDIFTTSQQEDFLARQRSMEIIYVNSVSATGRIFRNPEIDRCLPLPLSQYLNEISKHHPSGCGCGECGGAG